MECVKFGIIGIGNIGSAHAMAIYNGKIRLSELVCVCDISESRRKWAAENLYGVTVYDNDDDFFSDRRLDAVIIATPHYLHPPLAVKAFGHGLNVLTEKPAGVNLSSVRAMTEAAKISGKRFGIMWNQRTLPLYIRVRELVKSGALGELQRLNWSVTDWYRTQEYYDSGAWRGSWDGEGGGVLMNQAPHNLDLWLWIAGMPDTVYAVCREGLYHNIEVEDDAVLIAGYKNGAQAVFITSTGEKHGINRLEISGSKGRLCAEKGILKLWLEENGSTVYSDQTFEPTEDGHILILRDFTEGILTGKRFIAEGEEGENEIALVNAAYLSSWTRQTVSIPFDTGEFDRRLEEKRKTSSYKDLTYNDPPTGEYLKKWSGNTHS